MSRLWKAIAVTVLLGLVLGALSGTAQADVEETMQVPSPRPGDAAYYHIKDVVDDPDAILGPMHFDWASVAWGAPTTLVDPSGAPQPVVPVRLHTMYAQGKTYENEKVRDTYMTAAGPLAERWHYDTHVNSVDGMRSPVGTGTPVDDVMIGEVPAYAVDYSYLDYEGPKGLCGVLAPIHGAAEPPSRMAVPGYCRHDRIMEDDTHTDYHHVATTTWRDRTAYVYRPVDGPAYDLVYADGVPFPVEIEVTLSESVYDPWEVGRHFRFELQGFSRDGAPYALPPPVTPDAPLPLVPRVQDIHIDESGLAAGLTLRQAFDAAMADTASPRLADFMAREGAYLATAFRANTVDSDGHVTPSWLILATTGDTSLGKWVREEQQATLLGLDATQELVVDDPPFEIPDIRFPSASQLPDRVVSVAAALERQAAFHPANGPANEWGFYFGCGNDACTETEFEVRAGRAMFAEPGGMETQGRPAAHQRNVFFGEDGLAARTFVWEADGGSDGLIAPSPQENVPSHGVVASDARWVTPSAQAAASIGFLALLGGALYYFWPALKGGVLGLFTRIRQDEVLDHPRRQQVMDLIEAEPGIHFQEILRRTRLGRGTLEHHLQTLLQNDYVVDAKGSGYTCYYAKGTVDRRVMQAIPAIKADAARRIVSAVQGAPGVSGRTLARELGLAPSTVSYHTKRLLAAGLLSNGDGLHPTAITGPTLAALD